jgi:ubiquitin C-terminal hydrolase
MCPGILVLPCTILISFSYYSYPLAFSVILVSPLSSLVQGTDFKYSLYGVLVHAGWNTQSGHYYCFVRTSSGMWHNLDDNQVYHVISLSVELYLFVCSSQCYC